MSKLKIYLSLQVATIVAYYGSIKFGFSQDDWYFLYISTARNLGDILNFFNPFSQSGFAFYRPLGTQLYYYLSRLIFGLQGAPAYMHIFMIFVQSLASYNVYRLVKHLSSDRFLSLVIAVLYATSSVHFLSLYYIAATQQLLATLFSLLAINDYLEKKYIGSGIFFALGLLSKEVAIVAPVIMVLSEYQITKKFNLAKLIPKLTVTIIVLLIYIAIKLVGGLQVQSEYHFVLNSSVISTARWYLLFGYGSPEELVRYGLPKMAINYLGFIRDFGILGILTGFIPVGISLLAFYQIILGLWHKHYKVLIYLLWWILALLPVLLLQDHRYPHYVDLALIPMLLILFEGNSRAWTISLATLICIVSLGSIHLSESAHWTTKRAIISSSAVQQISSSSACSKKDWNILGVGDSAKQLSYALSLENGPRVICNREIQVYYLGVTQGEPPIGAYQMDTQRIIGL
ncbi:MAG: hypothetical protein WAV40_05220 [Microgenomates group bacterium]